MKVGREQLPEHCSRRLIESHSGYFSFPSFFTPNYASLPEALTMCARRIVKMSEKRIFEQSVSLNEELVGRARINFCKQSLRDHSYVRITAHLRLSSGGASRCCTRQPLDELAPRSQPRRLVARKSYNLRATMCSTSLKQLNL